MTWYTINDTHIDLSTQVALQSTLSAAKLTVEHIIEHYPPPYNIMISGGVDSQAMLLAWKWYGKEFIPTAVRYNGGMNDHDLETLAGISERESITIKYLEFDLLGFYEKDYHSLCEKYQCISPHFGAHLGMTASLTGTCIFSGDRLVLGPEGDHAVPIYSRNMCLFRASLERSIVPYFFLHTPELAYSMTYERLVGNFSDISPSKYCTQLIHDYENKVRIWQNSGFPVVPQDQKYTGFEKIKDYYDEKFRHKVSPSTLIKYANRPSTRLYDILLRYPYEDKFGNPPYDYLISRFTQL